MHTERYVLEGYKVCIHTCVVGGCPNSRGTILWKREGSNLRRHSSSRKKHAKCTLQCPGYAYLVGVTKAPFDRDATSDELTRLTVQQAGSISEDDDEMDVDNVIHITPRVGRSTISNVKPISLSKRSSTIDLNEDDMDVDNEILPQFSMHSKRIFRLVYIPDPTRAVTQERAKNDLAYLKTSITESEWNSIKGLEGSVHFLKRRADNNDGVKICTVLMQEWVIIQFILLSTISS